MNSRYDEHYYIQVSNMTKKMINCTHLQLLTQVRRQAAGQWDQDEEEVRWIRYFLYLLKIFSAGDGGC